MKCLAGKGGRDPQHMERGTLQKIFELFSDRVSPSPSLLPDKVTAALQLSIEKYIRM